MEDINAIIRLSPAEQIHYEKLQNIYSIIKTLEYLEWAYMSGKVKGPEYDAECRSLLHQYQMSSQAVAGYQGLDQFLRVNYHFLFVKNYQEYNLIQCQSAARRIAEGKSGYKGEDINKNLAQKVFDITQRIISAIDIVSLNLNSVDQISPAVRDIQTALNNYPNLPANYTGTQIIKKWVDFFHDKQATDELNETELRQLKFDLENVMTQFNEVVLAGK